MLPTPRGDPSTEGDFMENEAHIGYHQRVETPASKSTTARESVA